MFYNVLKFILSPIIKLLWLGKISGKENIPNKGSFIIAANHKSYLDFFLLSVVIKRRLHFLAAEVFFEKKLWIPLVRLTGQIKVDRKSKDKSDVYKEVDRLFASGGILGIFPEGTRSRDGKLNKGYNGVVKFAYRYKIPILPIGLTNTFEALPPHKKFPKFVKCNVNIGDMIIVVSEDYDYETKKLMQRIAELSAEVYAY
ncbi:1-acyl-sn-glycerol-3-phosphate acyltransferase [Candidatus Parcubacteria bacterium]|nr:MAG: 1-acyl-sn-glycerol-3-phosphate acyltransferase [Candidatus Parcubacteria bacterium]